MATANFDSDRFSGLTEKVQELKFYYDEEGIPGLAKQLEKQLNEWKYVQLKIAVIGRSGAGKSSFINALRGITADDIEHNPAEVDVRECTQRVQEYKYPGNDNLLLYDVPGLGTMQHQQKTYLATVDFKHYDFYIILTETRFMDDDLWLAQQAERNEKLFYFVRSKIANDIMNDKGAHPKTHNETNVLKKIKEDLESNLKRYPRKDIFLIDNYDTKLYEFDRLTGKLLEDDYELRQGVLAFSLACLSNEVLKAKKKAFLERIPIISFAAVLHTLPPFSDPDAFVAREVQLYGKQFSIDIASLSLGREACDLSEDDKKRVDAIMNSPEAESMKLSTLLATALPIVGNFAIYFKFELFLRKCLDKIEERAKEIHGLMTDSLSKKFTS